MREFSEEKKGEDPWDYLNAPNTPKVQNTRKSKEQQQMMFAPVATAIQQHRPNTRPTPPPPPPTRPPPPLKSSTTTSSSTTTLDNTASNSSNNSKRHGGRSKLATLLLDFPLFTLLTVYACIAWIHYMQDQYLEPQVTAALVDEERRSRDITYYMRQCDIRDLSTTNGADLFLPTNATADEAYEHQLIHGFTVFRSVLTVPTATALRNYALKRNKNLTVQDSIYVIENERRWSFGLGTDEPSVTNAITELTSHPQLNDAVEKILGTEPALIEMTTITVGHGAIDQWWHGDVTERGSPVRYARNFGPSYSIFVMLQNTTRAMGATGACPGTLYCARDDGATADLCDNNGFQIVNEDGHWATGDALLMNMNSWHRGAAHTDPQAPDRVMLILTFAPRPRTTTESRQLSQGITFSLRWDMWGHTWSDVKYAKTAMMQPWATLRALGLYKPQDAHWGIDFVTGSIMRLANQDTGFDEDAMADLHKKGGFRYLPAFLHDEFDEEDDNPWHGMLTRVFNKVEAFARRVVLVAIVSYMILTRVVGAEKFSASLRRLAVMCTLAYLIFGIARTHVDNTKWAKDIKANRRYSSVFANERNFVVPSSEVTTFPSREDVLFANRFDSDYLKLYEGFIDFHTGNRAFRRLVDKTAPSYAQYPTMFRDATAKYIVDAMRIGQGRFLEQGFGGKWFLLSARQAEKYTHKALASRASLSMNAMLKEIRYSISGFRFGIYRDAAMGSKHVVPYLRKLEQKLLDVYSKSSSSSKPSVKQGQPLIHPAKTAPHKGSDGVTVLDWNVPTTVKRAPTFKPLSRVVDTPQLDLKSTLRKPKFELIPKEPKPGAWFATGSLVEGLVDGFWYIGTVLDVSAHGKFFVSFPDGDEAVLDDRTMRPFTKYQVGERQVGVYVDLPDGWSEYVDCAIVGRMDDDTYHVRLHGSGEYHEGVKESHIRRAHVEARPIKKYVERRY